jgi:hypothetical protein
LYVQVKGIETSFELQRSASHLQEWKINTCEVFISRGFTNSQASMWLGKEILLAPLRYKASITKTLDI